MIKGLIEDTFEKLVEQGTTQAKKAIKSTVGQVKQTVSPTKIWEQILGIDSNPSIPSNPTNPLETFARSKSHTPLNLDKLGKSYQDKEKQKTEVLKQRLFQLVKRGEEEILEKKKQDQQGEIPKGRVRRSIFSAKKVAQRQHAEVKPASGKQ